MISGTGKQIDTKHATGILQKLQNPKVVWLTGLSGSGKTTLAVKLNELLLNDGLFTRIFDGDELRKGLCSDLGYSNADRTENIRRAAEVAKLFIDTGLIVICCFISPTEEIRKMAKTIIGSKNFIEVFIDCPLEFCEKRDVKGFYAKARKGNVKNFTGIDSAYENPIDPDLTIKTNEFTIEDSLNKLSGYLLPLLKKESKK